MRIYSFSPFGYEGSLVSVEVDLRRGIPAIDVVGLADGAVKEARERMRSAICNAGFEFPPERVLISLSPADLKKEGAGFDLAIALAVLQAKNKLDSAIVPPGGETGISAEKPSENNSEPEISVLVMGELELCGNVRPVRAVHAAAATAKSSGINYCIIPVENTAEANEISGMHVFSASNLQQAFQALKNPSSFVLSKQKESAEQSFAPDSQEIDGVLFPKLTPENEYADIHGQSFLVRGLQIAAAGGHNLMAFGSPGCGKTMALQKFPSLIPLLTKEEANPVTRIYSVAGILSPKNVSRLIPPFRSPHQTASIEGMCGGGPACKPGEISLAHNGVLFLDEAAEFKTGVLQMLRVPLESGSITLSRAGRSTVYPANFQLLLATNPCPCGNYGSEKKVCLCSSRAIEQYWKHFSGPLLDRIDLRIHVDVPDGDEHISTMELRKKIAMAVKIQRLRQGKKNSKLCPEEMESICHLDGESVRLLRAASQKYGFSPRAISACKKLARTIADLEGSENIKADYISEAIEYRKKSGGLEFIME